MHYNHGGYRKLLGYLPQDFRFFEKLKTWEFLDYGASLAGIKGTRKRGEAVDELLRKVGLYEVRDRWANRLSGGMKRRLGIAQAIVGNPKVIIVDEPTTGLFVAVPDGPSLFGLSDQHVVAVDDGRALHLSAAEKFGQGRIVDQIEQAMRRRQRLVG